MTSRSHTASKLLLVADGRETPAQGSTQPIRRFRLARLRLDGRSDQPGTRYEHLKRVFD